MIYICPTWDRGKSLSAQFWSTVGPLIFKSLLLRQPVALIKSLCYFLPGFSIFSSSLRHAYRTLACLLCRDRQVLEVVAAARGEDAQQLASVMYDNSIKLFFSKS